MDNDERKKSLRLMVCLSVTAIAGAVSICIDGAFGLLILYVICMGVSSPALYFNYSLCKWENRWHSVWNERNACDGEPSEFRLNMGKFGEWTAFIIGLIVAIIAAVAG